MPKHWLMHLILTLVLCLGLSGARAAPGVTPAGFTYPLDGLNTERDLQARMLSGGCWLSGLPGYPSYNGHNVHAGTDLRATLGDTIYAIAPGTVDPASDTVHSGYGPGWTSGHCVIVRCCLPDGTPYVVVYGHTENHVVKGGDRVAAGQPLAEVGPWLADQGGPHLHLTIRLSELPRYGWGTPTLAGQPLREGAEQVACAADVERAGYRNPIEFLRGDYGPQALQPVPAGWAGKPLVREPRAASDFAALAQTYWRGRPGAKAPTPAAEDYFRSSKPVRLSDGWLQTYRTASGQRGALLARDGEEAAYWVGEPLWTLYNLNGGMQRLGYPVREAYNWPEADAQGFEKALLVLERGTDRVRVIWRR